MNRSLHIFITVILVLFIAVQSGAQSQSCPLNINFATGDLTHWGAYTGNNKAGNGPSAIAQLYDTTTAQPTGTIGAQSIDEYKLNIPGIQVITVPGKDDFGNFPTIPIINGFNYGYSVKLGSTNITTNRGGSGGYIRGISYSIYVPNGSGPYTMTYAYAMVLENGSHATSEQPQLQANLTTQSNTPITCASYFYNLPTLNNAGNSGGGATLDAAAAAKEGFTLSSVPSPNNNGNVGESKYRVYTKGWTEVTFDLSPYRGQQVTLTFEADNCVPGGHFAYAYIALRNTCGGLVISGPSPACLNATSTYSVPALGNASYTWSYPSGWKSVLDSSNILMLIPGLNSGYIIANEVNSCANLTDSIFVTVSAPTIPGVLSGGDSVCTGTNSSLLSLSGNTGSILNWINSSDGLNWNNIGNAGSSTYSVNNLTGTTYFKAVVQNGGGCAIDSSTTATVLVSPLTVAGTISPSTFEVCIGQNKGANLTLGGYTGQILNWQYSIDTLNWSNINPAYTAPVFNLTVSNHPIQYRAIVKSGTCAADTSNIAYTAIFNAGFPQATISPADTTICFGSIANLNTTITQATEYSWTASAALYDPNNNAVNSNPLSFTAQAAPSTNAYYIISFKNASCPNLLIDTFKVNVIPPILVNVGNDTTIAAGQPLYLNALTNDSSIHIFNWTPATGLNNATINDPIALFPAGTDSIRYYVTASSLSGCLGTDSITVHVFNGKPDILVPSAFTPNGDGKNDILKPILIGITDFQYFRIYNRWGQLLYSTSQYNTGWDGTLGNNPQPSGTYVYVTQGTDYLGKNIFRKGTVVLIR